MPKKKTKAANTEDLVAELADKYVRTLRYPGSFQLDIKEGDVATLSIPIRDGAKTSEILEVLSTVALYVMDELS